MPILSKIPHVTRRAARLAALVGTLCAAPFVVQSQSVPACTVTVVPCNYAHMYSGKVSWTESITGPAGTFNAAVGVTIQNGVGFCTGSETSVSISQFGRTSRTGTISGKALVAVEFDFYSDLADTTKKSADRPLGYKVTVACPSADYPATPDGSPATRPTPAELDGRERSSYPQFATALTQKQLKGTNSSRPEDDPVNSVSSLLAVTWDLTRP